MITSGTSDLKRYLVGGNEYTDSNIRQACSISYINISYILHSTQHFYRHQQLPIMSCRVLCGVHQQTNDRGWNLLAAYQPGVSKMTLIKVF